MEIKRGTTSKKGKSVKDLPVKGKTGRKVKGGAGFEMKDWGFGVESPTTISSTTSTPPKK